MCVSCQRQSMYAAVIFSKYCPVTGRKAINRNELQLLQRKSVEVCGFGKKAQEKEKKRSGWIV